MTCPATEILDLALIQFVGWVLWTDVSVRDEFCRAYVRHRRRGVPSCTIYEDIVGMLEYV